VLRQIAFPLGLVVLFLCLAAGWSAVMRPAYFPPILYAQNIACGGGWSDRSRLRAVMTEFEGDWFSAPLRAAGEPALFDVRTPTLRFIWLPSFHDEVIVRLDGVGTAKVTMTANRIGGRGGNSRVVRDLTLAERLSLERTLAGAKLADQPVRTCDQGLDGSQWLIESTNADGYIFRGRWSPRSGPVHDVGMHLLALTGWQFETIY